MFPIQFLVLLENLLQGYKSYIILFLLIIQKDVNLNRGFLKNIRGWNFIYENIFFL